MIYFKTKVLPLTLLSLMSLNFIGCGSSSTKTERTTFDKAYYKSIDYSNVDKLATKFIGKDTRFVDLKTEIPLPVMSIEALNKNYTIKTLSQGQDEEGTHVFYYENEELLYQQFRSKGMTIIAFDDKTDSNDMIVSSFDEKHTIESDDPKVKGMSITKYQSDSLKVIIPEVIFANGSVTIEYDKDEDFAIIRDGTLGLNAFNKLVDITQNYPNIKTIVLKNIDGSVHDDINMQTGLVLRKAGLNTHVLDTDSEGTDIASGGVDLFTAGVKRSIENQETVKIGIHSWSGENDKGVTVEGKDFPKEDKKHHDQLLYFSKMLGVDKGYDFYFHTLQAADADDIHAMTDDELNDFNLLTNN